MVYICTFSCLCMFMFFVYVYVVFLLLDLSLLVHITVYSFGIHLYFILFYAFVAWHIISSAVQLWYCSHKMWSQIFSRTNAAEWTTSMYIKVHHCSLKQGGVKTWHQEELSRLKMPTSGDVGHNQRSWGWPHIMQNTPNLSQNSNINSILAAQILNHASWCFLVETSWYCFLGETFPSS